MSTVAPQHELMTISAALFRRSNPWSWAGSLLAAAGVLAASSALLFWKPCAEPPFGDWSDVCLVRMDTYLPYPYLPDAPDRLPWVSQLLALAVLLAALSWLALVVGVPRGRGLRMWAALTAVHPVSLGSSLTSRSATSTSPSAAKAKTAIADAWLCRAPSG